MSVFHLVRHARHDRLGKSLSGRSPGVVLNEQGRREAAALAERLACEPVRAVYTSPLERARETAESIAHALRLRAIVRDGLTEMDFGEWTGQTFPELNARPEWRLFHTRRTEARVPGGESITEVQSRMVCELASLHEVHAHETIVVVGHGDPLKSILYYLLGASLDLMHRIELDPASISTVMWSAGGARVHAINDVSHLRVLETEGIAGSGS